METKVTERHDIVEHSLENYTRELSYKLLDGWALSKTSPAEVVGLYGGTFTVSLFRDNSTVQRLKDRVEGVVQAPKLDRGTILANARAAKAARKTGTT